MVLYLYTMKNFNQIPDTDGKYLVNRAGEIMRASTGKLLKPATGTNGYLRLTLRLRGKSIGFSVHRLVASAFLPNPVGHAVVNHLNGIKTDNRPENLEWCSYRENSIHANRTGLTPGPPAWAKGKFGAAHNRSKQVYAYAMGGGLVGTYGSGNEAARQLGITPAAVAKLLTSGQFSRRDRYLFAHDPLTMDEIATKREKLADFRAATGARQQRPVRAMDASLNVMGEYGSLLEAAKAHGITSGNVMDSLRFNRTNRKTNLRFSYA